MKYFLILVFFFPALASMAAIPTRDLNCVIEDYKSFSSYPENQKVKDIHIGSNFHVDMPSGVVLGARVSNANSVYRRDVAEDTEAYSVTWTNTGFKEPPAVLFVSKDQDRSFWYADHVRFFSGHCTPLI
ncbi:hypothetical protein [Candidatus Marimicrobium litorale]|uniref:Uncharacterized protein n=1 Tax=Candidatus Marimicrobium litorale TaxID=2518991 RepID=A0ABT3T292_9GAMM|nr:hypothetical protein [Candidatus Marimicrobium litorale]MCX2976371.1 hypothetical protein [Candidatus Marimicrobium litorale]